MDVLTLRNPVFAAYVVAAGRPGIRRIMYAPRNCCSKPVLPSTPFGYPLAVTRQTCCCATG